MSVTESPSEPVAPPAGCDIAAIAARIGADVAAKAARDVDVEGRFPSETFAALKAARMLSVLVPTEYGGAGATISQTAAAVEALSQHCGSSGLIYAMHHIQVASIVRHASTPWLRDYLRSIVADELVLASATTEKGTGGDVSSSLCAVEVEGDTFRLHKDTPVISYGRHCDAILATARRGPESPASDQVIVVLPIADCTLERTSIWNTLGFRGTCSDGFVLDATGRVEQIVADPYADVSARTMLPTTHILWASVWLGIARQAVSKARFLLRDEARKKPGTSPASARSVAELVGVLEQFTALVHSAARDYDEHLHDDALLTSMGWAIRMNSLKTSASTLVVDIVGQALHTCGLPAYAEGTPYSLGLALRDAYGAALMIHNDRIYANTGRMLLVSKER